MQLNLVGAKGDKSFGLEITNPHFPENHNQYSILNLPESKKAKMFLQSDNPTYFFYECFGDMLDFFEFFEKVYEILVEQNNEAFQRGFEMAKNGNVENPYNAIDQMNEYDLFIMGADHYRMYGHLNNSKTTK